MLKNVGQVLLVRQGVGSLKHLTLGAVMVAAVKSFQSAAETEERP